jgi:hypothetical protein
MPESNKQRRYLEGAIISLITFYQEGMDHRNADDRASVREQLKLEFNGAMVFVGVKPTKPSPRGGATI